VVATTLFRDNMWKLHELLESVISGRGPQFVAELMKKLNKMLRICQARFTPGWKSAGWTRR